MAVVAPEHRQMERESDSFLADPADFSLVRRYGLGVGDLNAPTAL
jgi:hypothetical protein